MNILIVGSGGREYSLGLSLRNDKRVKQIYFAPGNGGTQNLGENINTKGNAEIAAFCVNNAIDLVVIGPEAALVSGLGDDLRENHIRVFAPSKKAAQLEGSKAFMKKLLSTYQIPTARFVESGDFGELSAFVDTLCKKDSTQNKIVIKADGLCAGKGVIIAQSRDEAKSVLQEMLSGKLFGEAGKRVVVEEFLEGFELSVFAICDGENFITLPPAQDHKRLLDNDLGPNTGGMGAYAPTPLCDKRLLESIKTTIIAPTLKAMKNEGVPFCGVLFCGIMVVDNKPFVLEFNVRFGDPECEVILPLLKTPLLDILNAAIDGKIKDFDCEIIDKYCVGVVLASKDYPNSSKSSEIIHFENPNAISNQHSHLANQHSRLSNQHSHLSFAGVENKNGELYTNGGRILVALGLGESIQSAKENAYKLANEVHFSGKQMRSDIANRALGVM